MLDHVIGWLAKVWTNLALVPKKRLIIVFPFVATKTSLAWRSKRNVGSLMPCIRKSLFAAAAVENAVIAWLQLARLPGGCASSAQTTRPGV
jgi:hypothetical protein